MTAEDNKNVVKRFVEAFAAGDLQQVDQLLTDDFTFWAAPTTLASGTYTKETWLEFMSNTFGDLAGPMTLQLGDLTAEDDRVSLTMQGNLPFKSGKVYNSHYHNLFWLRDGKIAAVKEYLDTYQAGEIFGFPDATNLTEPGYLVNVLDKTIEYDCRHCSGGEDEPFEVDRRVHPRG